mgnify:FL=1
MDVRSFPVKETSRCQDALMCFFDISGRELNLYRELLANGPLTASQMGDRICKDRSTAYRAATSLVGNGLAVKKKEIQEGGGIFHIYEAVPPSDVKNMLRERIKSWYRDMTEAVERTEEELLGEA